jgi:hypothetical protein
VHTWEHWVNARASSANSIHPSKCLLGAHNANKAGSYHFQEFSSLHWVKANKTSVVENERDLAETPEDRKSKAKTHHEMHIRAVNISQLATVMW